MHKENQSQKLRRIEHRLQCWAMWYSQLIAGKLGYASLPIDEIIKAGCFVRSTAAKTMMENQLAESMDAALQKLRQDDPLLGSALYTHYLLPGTGHDHARRFNVGRTTFNRYVHTGKIWLVAWFSAKGEL